MPWVTAGVVALCVIVFAAGGPEALAYQRSELRLWPAFGAAFAHYDLTHLVSNLAGFAMLGVAFERAAGSRALVAGIVVVVTLTGTVLHLLLDHYVTFAGISAVNYGLLGCLGAVLLVRAPHHGLTAMAMVGIWQALVAWGALPTTVASTRATWELHMLALGIGLALGFRTAAIHGSIGPWTLPPAGTAGRHGSSTQR